MSWLKESRPINKPHPRRGSDQRLKRPDETSFALRDSDLPKLLQCKECSVPLERLSDDALRNIQSSGLRTCSVVLSPLKAGLFFKFLKHSSCVLLE